MRFFGTWKLALVVTAAFVAVLAAFAFEIFSFRDNIERWARRDLRTQAQLAAANLDEPLRTQDFRRLHEIAARLEARGVILTIHSGPTGVFYRSKTGAESAIGEAAQCGDYRVELGFPRATVFRPFDHALVGFAIAACLGVLGMALVFLTLYRQRLRIRELARLERFRREFIADLSHEIKTPLTGILGAADMMDASDSLAGLVKKEASRLNQLVQQILDLARLEREDEILVREPVELGALVRETLARLEPKAAAASVALKVDDSVAPLVVSCDGRLIAQALANLVENAIRHSGASEVRLGLQREGSAAVLFVEDEGVGIPTEHRMRIFERFHRVDPARAAESGGAGLGLAIVRRIMNLHGGDVTCESVMPHGARFVLSLPMRMI